MTIRVGVLRGGPSSEHEVSLKTGESVLSNLPSHYQGIDIILTKQGEWLIDGKFAYPEKIFRQIDVAFNALHGAFGEDGKLQQILEIFNVPYTGSGILASSVGMNKVLSGELFRQAGLFTPRRIVIEKRESVSVLVREVIRKIPPYWVVKPANSGSSLGVSICKNYYELIEGVEIAFEYSEKIIVEEYIDGREATCGVIENFRGEEHYALPVIEIVPPEEAHFFDYNAKYSGRTLEICPANFDIETKRKIEESARIAHQIIGCRHYSRSDFVVSKRGVYILEINTLPGLTTESLLPKAINAIGLSYTEFLDHLISLALEGK